MNCHAANDSTLLSSWIDRYENEDARSSCKKMVVPPLTEVIEQYSAPVLHWCSSGPAEEAWHAQEASPARHHAADGNNNSAQLISAIANKQNALRT